MATQESNSQVAVKPQNDFQNKLDQLVQTVPQQPTDTTALASDVNTEPQAQQPEPTAPKKSLFQNLTDKATNAFVGTAKFLGQGVIDYANDFGSIFSSNTQADAESGANTKEVKAIADDHAALLRGDISHEEYSAKINNLAGGAHLAPGVDLPTTEQVIGDSINAGLTIAPVVGGITEGVARETAAKVLTEGGEQVTEKALQEQLPYVAKELIERPWLSRLVGGGLYGAAWGTGTAMSENKGLLDTLKQAALTAPFGALADLTLGPLLNLSGRVAGKVVDAAAEEFDKLPGKVANTQFGGDFLKWLGGIGSKIGSKATQADSWNLFSSVITKLSDQNMYGEYGKNIVDAFRSASAKAGSAMGNAVAAMEDAGFFQASEGDLWRNKGTSLLDRLEGTGPADNTLLGSSEKALSTEVGSMQIPEGSNQLPGEAVPPHPVDKLFETADNMRKEIMQMAENRIPNFSSRENYYPHLIPGADVLGNPKSKITQDIVDNMVLRHGFNEDSAQKFVQSYADFVKNDGRKGYGDEVINYMLQNGQADTAEEARGKLLRMAVSTSQDVKSPTYGPLEKPRDVELPIFDPNPARSLLTYGTKSLQRLSIVSDLGPLNEVGDLKMLNETIGKIQDAMGNQRGEEAASLIKNLTGQITKNFESSTRVATSKFLRAMQMFRISTAGLLHMNQSVNNLLEADFGPWVKGLMTFATDEGNRNALLSGATVEQTIQNHMLEMGQGRGLTDRYLGAIGLNKVVFANRTIAANTGMLQADHLLQKVLANPDDIISQAALGDLIGPKRVPEVIAEKTLQDADRNMAGNNFTDMTQRNYNPGNHPAFWNTPEGKVVTQFKTWAFDQGKFVKDSLMTKLQRGDTAGFMKALLALGVVMPATSEVLLDLKSMLTGGNRPTHALDRYTDDFVHMGGLGIFYDTLKSASYGKGLEAIAGPTGALGGNLLDTAMQKSKHKLGNFVKDILDVFGTPGRLLEKAGGIAPKPKNDPNNQPIWKQIFSEAIPTAQAKGEEPTQYSGVGVHPENPNIISNVDMTHYAANPQHPALVRSIYNGLPEIAKAKDIENYIQSKPNFKKSPITGDMVLKAANKYGVDPKLLMAEMQQDSGFGTQGAAAKNRNPGNVATYGKKGYKYPSWEAGVVGAARALARFRTADSAGVDYSDAAKYEPSPATELAKK